MSSILTKREQNSCAVLKQSRGCSQVATANHSLCYGECVKDHPFLFQGIERWRLAHDAVLRSGKYKVTIEVQGRNVFSVRKQFVFWGDKTGPHCVDADDPSAQSTEPLEFTPTEFDTLPPDMHPHQLRALVTELRKSTYDGMAADEVYRKLDDDVPMMCGLSQVRFMTAGALEKTTLKPGEWAVIISDEEPLIFFGDREAPHYKPPDPGL